MNNIFKRSLTMMLSGLMALALVTACQSGGNENSANENDRVSVVGTSTLDAVGQSSFASDAQLSTRRGRTNQTHANTASQTTTVDTKQDFAVEIDSEIESDENAIGAEAALADENMDMLEMLKYAMEDEYLARDAYVKIMDKYGEIRPFSSIKKAEDTHIKLLTPLFAKYELELPEYTAAGGEYPGTLQEAYSTGVEAEIKNIDMYERFLEQEDLPADVSAVFQKLLNASEKHLKAFERKA